MAERTIDLRKLRTDARAADVPVVEKRKSIEWSALEYEERERRPYWFLGPGIIALGLVVFGIFTKSYFFAAFITLAFALYITYARRAPRKVHTMINAEGVQAGRTFLPYKDLKTFWIFDENGRKDLSLETNKTLTPFLQLSLGEIDPEDVRSVLGNFLPETEHQELISDQIARGLGL